MPTTTSQYSGLPNKLARAANGVDYAYRDTGPEASSPGAGNTVPLVLFQHFRGNLDNLGSPITRCCSGSAACRCRCSQRTATATR